MQNKHSIRLLPQLEKILTNNNGIAKKKNCDLRYLNSLFGTKYKRYSQLIKFVLEPIKEELDNNSSLTLRFVNIRETLGKRGKPPITSIDIIPVKNNNYAGQKSIPTTTNTNKNQKAVVDAPTANKYEPFVIDKLYINKIENELGYEDINILKEQSIFLDFCKKNSKNYKDMSRSFYTHLKKKRELGL